MRGLGLSAVMQKQPKQQKASEAIPIDLLIDIFSRVPAKYIARFRCVSKEWDTILHRRDFTEQFLTASLARPRFLFAIQHNRKWLFLSAPEPLNLDQCLSPLGAYHYKPFPTYFSHEICAPVRGLICTQSRKPMICNPSTGQYVALPIAAPIGSETKTLFGYDPVTQIFKVLLVSEGYRVLTFGTGQLFWRTTECSIPHFPLADGICINGVLYYLARRIGDGNPEPCMVVCFNVRCETFEFLGVDEEISRWTLINWKGKLGAAKYDFHGCIHENARIRLLVLDDPNVNLWLEHIYIMPLFWSYLALPTDLHIAGMTPTGEIVLSPYYTLADPFCICYYNLERNTIVMVEVELGIEASSPQRIYTFSDHIENVKPMQMIRLQ